MEKKTVSTEVEPVEQPKCLTKWEAFEEAGLVPTEVWCWDYFPASRVDMSCHSRLMLNGEAVVRHMSPEHGTGGGFKMKLKRTERKSGTFWADLKKSGVELHDFRCDVCDKDIPLTPRRILKHMEAHSGRTHNTVQGGTFLFSLRFDPALEGNEEEF